MKLKTKHPWGYRKLVLNNIDEYKIITFELSEFTTKGDSYHGSEHLHFGLKEKKVKELIKFLKKQLKYDDDKREI